MKIPAYVDKWIPRPRVQAGKLPPVRPIKRFVVFVRLPSPTFDYFLAKRLDAQKTLPPAEILDIAGTAVPEIDPDGVFAIFCRYASRSSLNWVEAHAKRLAGVGLFIDDDLAAWVVAADAPIGYRLFLARHGLLPLPRLNRHLDRVWTATKALARSIGDDRAIVLPPAPRPVDFAAVPGERAAGPIRIAFFAEFHASEHRFLLPIMAKVLQRRSQAQFEVTDSKSFSPRWRKLPRVVVSPFRPWPEFRVYTAANPADIALVPLMPSRVNLARSPTKRIDVARMGAAGIFSQSSSFEQDAEPGELFLPNDQEAWVEGIVRLIDDAALRARAAGATRLVVERLAAAPADFPGLEGSFTR
jgi:hypothetical protein